MRVEKLSETRSRCGCFDVRWTESRGWGREEKRCAQAGTCLDELGAVVVEEEKVARMIANES